MFDSSDIPPWVALFFTFGIGVFFFNVGCQKKQTAKCLLSTQYLNILIHLNCAIKFWKCKTSLLGCLQAEMVIFTLLVPFGCQREGKMHSM